ncbi:MAG: two-component system, sensor histidine kinase [Chloroflexota bacterium]|jgi:signal transduction histidine kinase|nr:two-component system, sensor histidine kinase [Chloroflexota bacterium]
MDALLHVLQYASAIAFGFLGVVSVIDLVRQPSRRRAYVAMALGMLALVSAIGRVTALVGSPAWLTDANLAAFQLSAFGLLLLRNSFIKVPIWGWLVAIAALGGSVGASILVGNPPAPATPTPLQATAVLAVVSAWIVVVVEPSVRFALASRGLPVVQRRRMQALSFGYLALVLVLLTVFLPRRTTNTPTVQIATSLFALVIAPALYAGFSPPRWLRRVWRESEEEPYREAVRELLLYSADRAALAHRSLDWALRLVGADFGMVLDGDGVLLAVTGASADVAAERAHRLLGEGNSFVGPDGGLVGSAIVLPLPLDNGKGYLMVEAGPFTPLFGQEEVLRLRQYAAALTASLDRTRVAERVIALEEVKSRFLKLASHELRGPLALVKGYLSMVVDGSLSSEELQRVMPMIQARLEQMTGMLNEMLDTARLEDDRLELKPERFDMRHAVTAVAEALKPLAGPQRPVTLSLPEHEVPVVADRARVETIVTNLIDNAIKYSPRGGHIDCIVEVRDGDALVAVTDHGIGIAREDMTTLFTRFGRVTSDATVSIPGTGLGLYLSRELARLQQGDLTAHSEAGHGSTFTLQLPLAA